MVIIVSKEIDDGDGFIISKIVANLPDKEKAEEYVISYCKDKSNKDLKEIVSWKFMDFHGFESKENRTSWVKFSRGKFTYIK